MPIPSRASALVVATFALLAAAAMLCCPACSRRDAEEDEGDAAPSARPVDAGPAREIADASAPFDARSEEERLSLADAGRFCGGKDLPDCPLQAWMKQNATTLLGFGEISSVAEVFDRIVLFEPPKRLSAGADAYPYWASIARDGAAAARMGNLTAATAACRGCHDQYLPAYHAQLRALPLPPLPALPRP